MNTNKAITDAVKDGKGFFADTWRRDIAILAVFAELPTQECKDGGKGGMTLTVRQLCQKFRKQIKGNAERKLACLQFLFWCDSRGFLSAEWAGGNRGWVFRKVRADNKRELAVMGNSPGTVGILKEKRSAVEDMTQSPEPPRKKPRVVPGASSLGDGSS